MEQPTRFKLTVNMKVAKGLEHVPIRLTATCSRIVERRMFLSANRYRLRRNLLYSKTFTQSSCASPFALKTLRQVRYPPSAVSPRHSLAAAPVLSVVDVAAATAAGWEVQCGPRPPGACMADGLLVGPVVVDGPVGLAGVAGAAGALGVVVLVGVVFSLNLSPTFTGFCPGSGCTFVPPGTVALGVVAFAVTLSPSPGIGRYSVLPIRAVCMPLWNAVGRDLICR